MMNRVGQHFGNYRLVSFLGQGGFAEVYLGEHVLMRSSAAIKILNAQLISTDSQSFIQEARTLVTLEHPRIVRVKECGIEGGIPFLVMDYAPNGTLRQRHPGRTRVPLEQVISYVSQVADALKYAHDHRFIHRDVKPENMLVGRSGEVLLSDFGIAVMSATSSIRYNKDSAGTAIYMAPEQIERQALPASDQYALGIVVYEWLCGEVPFQGSFGEITAKHLHTPPPPFRQKGVNVPPVVEGIVMKALAKKPEERFPSVKEFALALQQSSMQQIAQSSKGDSWRDDSLILADPGQPSPFTVTPVIPQQPHEPVSTPPLANVYGAPPPSNTYRAPYAAPPGSFVSPGQPPTPPTRRKGLGVGLIIGIVVLLLLAVGGGLLAFNAAKGGSKTNTATPTATTAPSTPTTSSITPTPSSITPTPTLIVTPTTGATSPSGAQIDPAAAAIITKAQTSSAIDSNDFPTQLTSNFNVGQNVYVTFNLTTNGQSGYTEEKLYSDTTFVGNKILTIQSNFDHGYFTVTLNQASTGTVELYWCSQSDCSDAKLATFATFTVA